MRWIRNFDATPMNSRYEMHDCRRYHPSCTPRIYLKAQPHSFASAIGITSAKHTSARCRLSISSQCIPRLCTSKTTCSAPRPQRRQRQFPVLSCLQHQVWVVCSDGHWSTHSTLWRSDRIWRAQVDKPFPCARCWRNKAGCLCTTDCRLE